MALFIAVLLQVQHPGPLAGEWTGKIHKGLEAQHLEEGQAPVMILDNLGGIEDVTHAIEGRAGQRRADPLHHRHDDAIVLYAQEFLHRAFTKLPGHGIGER